MTGKIYIKKVNLNNNLKFFLNFIEKQYACPNFQDI